MTQASDELQAAVYSTLAASAALKALISDPVPVFDEVPEGQPMPYIEIDEPGSREWDVSPDDQSEGYGKEHELMLHVWSSYEGKAELNSIMAAIESELREFTGALVNHLIVNFRLQFMDRVKDPDGQARHGVMQFRVITEEGTGGVPAQGAGGSVDEASTSDGLSTEGGFLRVDIDELPAG